MTQRDNVALLNRDVRLACCSSFLKSATDAKMESARRVQLDKIPAHDTAALDVNFRFSDGVAKVFKNPSELRIHYSSQQGSGLARVTVVRSPLNAK